MSLNQMHDGLNDVFETSFEPFGPIKNFCFRVLGRLVQTGIRLRIKLFGGHVLTNERVVEYAQAIRWLAEGRVSLDGEQLLFDQKPLRQPLQIDADE